MPSAIREIKTHIILESRPTIIEQARKSFWSFCKALHTYKQEWEHLRFFCNILQSFYERKLINQKTGKPYKKLMVNMPPRHYKTRTLVLFSAWVLGVNNDERIISTSYSDDLATEFSRYTRDEIDRQKNFDFEIVYSDIFPGTKIKQGDSSYKKWALEGKHFSYKGAGIGSSITGKGCSIGIIDDQVKNYEEAVNEIQLEKKWNWYTGTFKSRLEEGSIEIICMTRWAEKDICGMILNNETEKGDWYHLSFEAYNKDTDSMLCPYMLSKDSYIEKQKIIDEAVFLANYHNITVEKKGRLYNEIKTYDKLYRDKDNNIIGHRRMAYIDTADEGQDYLCGVFGVEYANQFYVLDILYTKEPQEITEEKVADLLIKYDIKDINIESNNGGRAFARNIDRIVKEKYKRNDIVINSFFQNKNKLARILTNASNVQSRVLFPQGWNYKYPTFYKDIVSFMKTKQNKHDDGPDALTGIVEMLNDSIKPIFRKAVM